MSELLTLSQMAERLGCNTQTLRKYVNKYRIPFVGLGRNRRFNPVKVEKYLESKAEYGRKIPDAKPVIGKTPELHSGDYSKYYRELGLA